MVVALPELGAEALILIAMVACIALYTALYFLRTHAPKWSLLGHTFDLGAVFEDPLRLVAGWIQDLEVAQQHLLSESWHLILEIMGDLANLLNLAEVEAVKLWTTVVMQPLWELAHTVESDVSGLSNTLYHGAEGVVNRVKGLESLVGSFEKEFGRLWTEVNSLPAKLEKTIAGDINSLRTELQHFISASIGTVVGDVRAVEKDVARLEASLANLAVADVHGLEHELEGLASRIGAVAAVLTPAVIRDLPDLERLLKDLGKITGLPAELVHIEAEIGTLAGDIASIPRLGKIELDNIAKLAGLLSWILPLLMTGAITTELIDAWKLMRDGECPCVGISLGDPLAPFVDAFAADVLLKDGV